jgi:cell division protein FtsB
MNRETLDSLDKETLIRLILSQVEAIECLTREVEALRADNAKLHADNAALRAKLNLPAKDARKFQHSAEPGKQSLG